VRLEQGSQSDPSTEDAANDLAKIAVRLKELVAQTKSAV
jgi:hypothetical protein